MVSSTNISTIRKIDKRIQLNFWIYEGTCPVYFVSDVEFRHEILIKQFSNVRSCRIPFILRLSNGNHVHLFGADGNRWRR